MSPELRRRWVAFNAPFEGRVQWMYLDIKGLVTTGVGNLIDPVEYAVTLPWRVRVSGWPASEAQIRAEWSHIKAQTDLARMGAVAAGRVATLVLTDDDIDALVLAKLDSNHETLRRRFPEIDQWPLEAQIAVHSMAWAMGPGFPRTWPRFSAACDVKNWASAAAECWIPDAKNPGLVPRNAKNRDLLKAASNAAPALPPGRGSPAVPPAVAGPAPERERAAPGWLETLIARLLALFGKRAG